MEARGGTRTRRRRGGRRPVPPPRVRAVESRRLAAAGRCHTRLREREAGVRERGGERPLPRGPRRTFGSRRRDRRRSNPRGGAIDPLSRRSRGGRGSALAATGPRLRDDSQGAAPRKPHLQFARLGGTSGAASSGGICRGAESSPPPFAGNAAPLPPPRRVGRPHRPRRGCSPDGDPGRTPTLHSRASATAAYRRVNAIRVKSLVRFPLSGFRGRVIHR